MRGYENFRIFWETWKQNTKRPENGPEAENWDTAAAIFVSIADGGSTAGTPEALGFVRDSLPGWRVRLKAHSQWDSRTDRLRLYRGLRDQSAIEARLAGKAEIGANRPTSFALDRASALRFAGQGTVDGYLGAADVPLDAIVFADLDGLYREGNSHLETEIIVVTREPLLMSCEVERVSPGVRPMRTKSQKTRMEEERRRLEELEAKLVSERKRE